jgi:signal transduction histidine kinase/ligand-binding sensor domain-containing protein/CheY-like chemotaxis protein/HPt (histidine-containing phosphotransfer) domain-containing protein
MLQLSLTTKKSITELLLIGLTLYLPITTAAPDLHFVTVNDDRYLSSNLPASMIQDHQGFIWMATSSGLYRYDGYQSHHFEHDPYSSSSLPHDKILTLLEDTQHRLWIGTRDGLAVLNAKTNSFNTFTPQADQGDPLQNRVVQKIISDGGNGLWVGTHSGLQHFDPDTGQFKIYLHDSTQTNSLGRDNIQTLTLDKQGGLWIATWPGGLDYLAAGSSTFVHHQINPKDITSLSNNIKALFIDSKQRLWIGTEAGIFLKQDQDFVQKKFLPIPGVSTEFRTYSFAEDHQGTVWAGTFVGLLRWDETLQQFDIYQHKNEDPYSLAGNQIIDLLLDKSQSLWISTGDGINRADLSNTGLTQLIPRTLKGMDDRVSNSANVIAKADFGKLWLGGWSNLLLIDPNSRQIIKKNATGKKGLPSSIIYSLYPQPNGILWIGTHKGLIRYNTQQERFQTITLGDAGSNFINKIAPGHHGSLWLGTGNGLIEYDPASGILGRFQHNPADPTSLNSNSVSALLIDASGKIWVGSGDVIGGGLSVLDPVTGKFRHYYADSSRPGSLPSNFIIDIKQDRTGSLWLATLNGISRAKVATDGTLSFNNYNTDNGLNSNNVRAINVEQTGKIWLTTTMGISLFEPATEQFINYNFLEGSFIGRRSNGSLILIGDDLYSENSKGLTVIRPKLIRSNSIGPVVAFTDISILNHSLTENINVDGVKLEGSITEPKNLSIPWHKSVFSLKFSALHYANPKSNQYAYKLEGFDQDWIDVDSNNRIATYTNLNPGQYLFRVKASNNTGIWNTTGISLPITIIPPYWKTLWFTLLMVASLLLLLTCGYFWRIRQLKKIQSNLEDQVKSRTEELTAAVHIKSTFLANMSHEIRTPMNAIIGITQLTLKTDLSEKQQDYLSKIHHASTWLLGIINDILDFSKLEAGKLHLEYANFSLNSVMLLLQDLVTPLLEGKQLELRIEVNPEVPNALIGDSLRLGQVLLNLLSNAIKFTTTGFVTLNIDLLSVDEKQASLCFSVTDTGIGLSKEHQSFLFKAFTQADSLTTRNYGGTGLGLSISQELVTAMGGTINIESSVDMGSRFYFNLTLDLQSPAQRDLPLISNKKPLKYPTLNNAYLLLVDDNPLNQEFMPELLAHEGIRVDLASNGEQAIAMIAMNNYWAVLMDCQMPVMDGYQASRLIRADPRFAELPIIAMTANVMKEDQQRCLASGMSDHIGKPIDWEIFFQTLVRWVKPPIEVLAKTGQQISTDMATIYPELTGIDMAIAKKQTGNNANIYRKMLVMFHKNHGNDLALISAAYQSHDYESAVHRVHKLNGSASSIGMPLLSTLTKDLERAINQRHDTAIPILLEKIASILNPLIAEINRLE